MRRYLGVLACFSLLSWDEARAEALDPANRAHCAAALTVYHTLAVRQGNEKARAQLDARIRYDLLVLKGLGGLTAEARAEGLRVARELAGDLDQAVDFAGKCAKRQESEADFVSAMS